MHLVEAVIGLLEELLQAFKTAGLQVRLICVLVSDECAPGGTGWLSAPLLTCLPIRTLPPSTSPTLKISLESDFCAHCTPDGPPSSPHLHAHPSLLLPSAPALSRPLCKEYPITLLLLKALKGLLHTPPHSFPLHLPSALNSGHLFKSTPAGSAVGRPLPWSFFAWLMPTHRLCPFPDHPQLPKCSDPSCSHGTLISPSQHLYLSL